MNKKEDELTAYERVQLARSPQRPNAMYYVNRIFDSFFELHGDRLYGDDRSIVGGLASFHGRPVTVLAQNKGKSLEENLACHFGMPSPEGYRKALRLMRQAEKFGRPVITFIDTPGAYPGMEAEERGQGEAIARCLMEMSDLSVPVIAVVIGEGGSGGALALSVANVIVMLENAVYSVLSPEGFAAILWKDASRSREASEVMRLTSFDLYSFGVADRIIGEPRGGVTAESEAVFQALDRCLRRELSALMKKSRKELVSERYRKYREMGTVFESQSADVPDEKSCSNPVPSEKEEKK